jgi:hypothetical protein
MSGHLIVGLSPDETEVIVNVPFQADNGTGWTHVTFSREQAESFGRLVLLKAGECKGAPRPGKRAPVTIDAETTVSNAVAAVSENASKV